MSEVLEDLIERLVEDVALTGTHGFSLERLRKVVESYCDGRKKQLREELNPSNPSGAHTQEAAAATINDELIKTIWKRLENHSDIRTISLDIADGTREAEPEDPTTQSGHANKRLLTSAERMWKAIAGHGVNHKLIPPRLFDCLSVIAAHGPDGVLQPQLRKITGQQKQSVPQRTDKLAQKGYITKRTVLAHGAKTSLLKLNKFAAEINTTDSSRTQDTTVRHPSGMTIIDYDLWFEDTIGQLKAQPDHLLALQDLRIGLGIHMKRHESRALMRCIRRMAQAGVFRKCSAKPASEQRSSMGKEIRCIQLVREPTAKDKETWKNRDRKRRYSDFGVIARNSGEEDVSVSEDIDVDVPGEDDEEAGELESKNVQHQNPANDQGYDDIFTGGTDMSESANEVGVPTTSQLPQARKLQVGPTISNGDQYRKTWRTPRGLNHDQISSEKDQSEFREWAKATAERLVSNEMNRQQPYAAADPPLQLPQNRLCQKEAELLSMSCAGIYINPPGARNLKALTNIRRGRPRNALIAVAKSDRLRELDFFQEEQQLNVPFSVGEKPTRNVTGDLLKYTHHNIENQNIQRPGRVHGSGNPGNYNDATTGTPILEKENAEAQTDHLVAVSARGNPSHLFGALVSPGRISQSVDTFSGATQHHQVSHPDRNIQTTPDTAVAGQRVQGTVNMLTTELSPKRTGSVQAPVAAAEVSCLPALPKKRGRPMESMAAENMQQQQHQQAVRTTKPSLIVNLRSPGLKQNLSAEAKEKVPQLEYLEHGNNTAAAQIGPEKATYMSTDDIAVPERNKHAEAESIRTTGINNSSRRKNCYSDDASMDDADMSVSMADDGDLGSAAASLQRKKGKATSRWDAEHLLQRRYSIILSIIRQCCGVFPGNGEIGRPFATEWFALYNQTPDRRTINDAVKNMLDSGKLKKITFTFRSEQGANEIRSLLSLPTIEPDSVSVKEVKKAIIESFPAQYIPEVAGGPEKFCPDHESGSLGGNRPPLSPAGATKSGIYKDEFPVLGGVSVQRTKQSLDLAEGSAKARASENPGGTRRAMPTVISECSHQKNKKKRSLEREPGDSNRRDSRNLTSNNCETDDIENAKAFRRAPTSEMKKYRRNRDVDMPSASVEWLLRRPGQGLHGASGTFNTNGCLLASELEIQNRTRAKVLGAMFADNDTWHSVNKAVNQRHPSTGSEAEDRSQQPAGQGKPPSNFGNVSPEEHAEEELARVNTRRRRSKRPPAAANALTASTPTSTIAEKAYFLKDYVKAHPDQKFRHVGHGRYKMIDKIDEHDMSDLRKSHKPRSSPHVYEHAATQPWTVAQTLDASLQLDKTEKIPPSAVPDNGPHDKAAQKYRSRKRKAPAEGNVLDADNPIETRTALEHRQKKHRHGVQHEVSTVEAEELVVAIALVRLLCGGVYPRTYVKWSIVSHALSFKYDTELLRMRWVNLKARTGVDMEKILAALREAFLSAYLDDGFPSIDFNNIGESDWPALLQWSKTVVATLEVPLSELGEEAESGFVVLPRSLKELYDQYMVSGPLLASEAARNIYFTSDAQYVRNEKALENIQGTPLPNIGQYKHQNEENLELLKSWCRAVCMTKPDNYDEVRATFKLGTFSDAMIKHALDDLQGSQILIAEKKDRQQPGRNLSLSRNTIKQFQRWPDDDSRYLRAIAAARSSILLHFEKSDRLKLSSHTKDPEMVVLTNMVAQEHVQVISVLPERNDNINAPLPRFGIWGVNDISSLYNSNNIDQSSLRFPLVYQKSPNFVDQHGLRPAPIPMQPVQVQGEPGPRIPLWVDIHGNLIDNIWDMVLCSLLNLVVYRPGSTAKEMERAHDGKFWRWEIEMVLEWMETVGLAVKFGDGHEKGETWMGGWKASEWWYCAFTPEIATWQARTDD